MAKKTSNKGQPRDGGIRGIVKQVELHDLRLLSCRAQIAPVGDKLPDELNQQVTVTTGLEAESSLVRVIVQLTLSGGETATEPKVPIIAIEAGFGLTYKLGDVTGVTLEQAQGFGQLNGVFNAWPYWREFVQNTTARMGLPPLRVPLLAKPLTFGQAAPNSHPPARTSKAKRAQSLIKFARG